MRHFRITLCTVSRVVMASSLSITPQAPVHAKEAKELCVSRFESVSTSTGSRSCLRQDTSIVVNSEDPHGEQRPIGPTGATGPHGEQGPIGEAVSAGPQGEQKALAHRDHLRELFAGLGALVFADVKAQKYAAERFSTR